MGGRAGITQAGRLTATLPPTSLAALRRRTVLVLFASVALGSTGYIAAVTAGTLAAAEIGGSATLGGLPTTAMVVGTAAASALLSALMVRSGRRRGILAGLSIGALGGAIAVLAVVAGSIPLLLLGSALAAAANSAAQLARYVAADLYPPERRATALGTVVWGATIGSVIGPNLLGVAGSLATAFDLPPLAGAYLFTLAFALAAVLLAAVLLRPEPYALADASSLERPDADTPAPSVGALLGVPSATVALVSLVAGQVVMVLIMTMTPLHITAHGHGLDTVGFVLSAHTFGMFALSPISGRLTDRFGSPAIIGAGLALLGVASVLAALAPGDGGPLLTLALFLLGYGWNLGFVAGSTLLTRGLALGERTRLQGVADATIWSGAALASLSSGFIVAGASYAVLGLVGLALLVAPVLVLLVRLPRLRPAT